MKNKKLLMPLAGVAALGAVSPIVVMATSCGEKADASVKGIEASLSDEWPAVYVGTTITKKDIVVVATMTSGVIKDLDQSEWTCSEIGDNGYKFTTKGWKTFDIAYKGHHTSLEVYAAAEATIIPGQINVVYDANFKTGQKLHLYATSKQQEQLHEVDLSDYNITTTGGIAYDETTGCVYATSAESGSIQYTHKEYPALTDNTPCSPQTASAAGFTAGIDDDGNAFVTPTQLTEENNIMIVPEYVVSGTELVPTTYLTKDGTVTGIDSIYMPSTIKNIAAGLFSNNDLRNIIFAGTKAQWNSINAGDNWAGAGCVGGYCLGGEETEFVYFSGCQGGNYDSEGKFFMSEKAVGRADLIPGYYTVEFDLAQAYLAGVTDFTKLINIELINGSRLSGAGRLRINSIYVDGETMTTSDDYDEVDAGSRYLHQYTFTNTTEGKGAKRFTATSRIIIKFQTPATSLNSVNVKLSFAA